MKRKTQREKINEILMRKTAELTAKDSKNETPILSSFLGKKDTKEWNMKYATSDLTDPDGVL